MYPGGMLEKSRVFWAFEVKIMKSIMKRAAFGFPLGIAIGHVITIFGSYFWGNGQFAPCDPEMIAMVGNEIHAVMVQTLLCGLLGAAFSGAAVVWEQEDWSLAKQSGVYFLTMALVMIPIAYVNHWMEHSLKGFLNYFGIFTMIFLLVWGIQYTAIRYHIKKVNASLENTREE